jgi:demethylmenaquinone methyltransferase/2-methoxy-6-polyprenyl-1,4-benzoquinol methylase
VTLSPHAAGVRRMFGDVAPRYDLLNHLLSLRIDMRWRRRAVAASLRPGDTRVLDLCCGTGDLALAYAWRMEPGGVVIGADFARPMLTLFQRKVSRLSTLDPRISMMETDSLALPFRDAMFDVVSIAFGLRNLDDPAAGLREMARVARPRGRVVVLDFCPPARPRLVHRIFNCYFRRVLPRIGALVSGHPTAYRYLPESVGRFPPRERLEEIMRGEGLRVTTSRDLTGGVATLLIGEKT